MLSAVSAIVSSKTRKKMVGPSISFRLYGFPVISLRSIPGQCELVDGLVHLSFFSIFSPFNFVSYGTL